MEVFSLMFLLLLVLIAPVILIFQMWRVIGQVREENKALSDLIHKLEPLIRKLSDDVEGRKEKCDVPMSVAPEIPKEELSEAVPEGKPECSGITPPPLPPPLPPRPVSEFSAAPVIKPKPEKPVRRNMEKIIGENLMSKIGILALIIGIGFFVKFAIDNDWINEMGRTVTGLAAGIGLWGIAYPLRDRYRNFSSVLAGGGFAICFVTVAVAYNFYALFRSGTAFGIFIALTTAMIWIALRFDRRELAMTGFIGGFVAPFLAVGDTNSCVMLFGYITVLNAGIFLVTLRRNWWELAALGCMLTWLVTSIYSATEKSGPADSAIMLAFATLFVIMFSIPLATVLNRDTRRSALFFFLLVSVAVNFFSYLLLGLKFIADVPLMCRIRGIVPFIAGAISLLMFYRFYRRRADMLMQNLLLGASAVFATLVTPVQYSDLSVVTVSFAVLTLAFAGVYGFTRRRLFAVGAMVLGVIEILTLLYGHPVSINDCGGYSTVWTYALSGMCYIAIAWIISRKWNAFLKFGKDDCRVFYGMSLWFGVAMMCAAAYLLAGITAGRMEAMTAAMTVFMTALVLVSLLGRNSGYVGWLFPGAGALFFILIWCEPYSGPTVVNEILQWTGALLFVGVMSLQGNRMFRHRRLTGPFGRNGFAVYFSLSATVFVVIAIGLILRSVDLSRYYSAGFSIGLIICGAMLMAAGMRYRSRVVRMLSISVFGLLLLKLVVYDIWGLPMIGRIVVFILLGAVMLAISFIYQRLRKNIFGDDGRE